MPMIEFEYGKVHHFYGALAQREAVLSPLFRAERIHDARFRGLQGALRCVWRKRVWLLRDAGLPQQGRFVRMCNCPPFGIIYQPKPKPCGCHRLCPFCRARFVSSVYDRIAAASAEQLANKADWE